MPRTARSGTTTTDHDEIRAWVEARGGYPAAVKRRTRGDAGILRIDFPGYRGKNLERISWDKWFEAFDESNLAFLHRDQDRFNKLVSRESAAPARGKTGVKKRVGPATRAAAMRGAASRSAATAKKGAGGAKKRTGAKKAGAATKTRGSSRAR